MAVAKVSKRSPTVTTTSGFRISNIVGNSTSRAVRRGGNSWTYTPRGYTPERNAETGT